MERFEGYLKTIFMGGVSVGWLVVCMWKEARRALTRRREKL